MSALRQAFRHSPRFFPRIFSEVYSWKYSSGLLQSTKDCRTIVRSNLCTTACSELKAPKINDDHDDGSTKQVIGKIEHRMKIMFTCKKCDTRNSKTMTKLAYEKGVVIIRCDGCKNNHLIADNLGWFGLHSTKRNIEKILKDKGETVTRINDFSAGTFEALDNEEYFTSKT